MPPSVRVQVFGRFCARLEPGGILSFRTSRAAELVARLVLQRGSRLTRAALAQEIWPESDRQTQLSNLRPALSYARSAIGDEMILQADNDTLVLTGAESDWDDALRREKSALSFLPAEERLNALLRLDNQIRKPLLDGWKSEWIGQFRDLHERRRVNVLRLLSEEFGSKGDWEAGLEFATQILEIDFLSEQGIRLKLRFLGQLGRTDEGVQVFKEYRARLNDELGLKVSNSLREYARTILTRPAELQTRPLTSLQQEFIQGLITNLLETDPNRIMTLLASPSLNWEAIRHGPELIPLLEQAVAKAPTWTEDRAGVLKRILNCYCQFADWDSVKKYANELYQKGSNKDRIAALNFQGIRAVELGLYGEAMDAYNEAIERCVGPDLDYFRSMSSCNRVRLLNAMGRASEALPLIEKEYESMRADQSLAGKFAAAQHMFLHVESSVLTGEYKLAMQIFEKARVFTELNGFTRHFEPRMVIASQAFVRYDPTTACELARRGIEAQLSNRYGVGWCDIACLSINALCILGRQKAAEHLTSVLEATNGVIHPPFRALLPKVKTKAQPMEWQGLLLEIYDELRRI